MLLVINKMLLTHASIIRITLARSLEAFGTLVPNRLFDDIFMWFRVNKKKQNCFELKLRRNTVKDKLMKFLQEEDGLTIVEYAVAAGLITATVAAAFFTLGGTIEGIITTIDGYLTP